MTLVINIIASPCSGKSTLSCSLFAKLKKLQYDVEYISEFAKTLVWQQDFEKLNDQYYISMKQYKILKDVYNKVNYIICDSPLLTSLFYNRYNKNNFSNIEKTEKYILEKNSEFNNIYIFIRRDRTIPYMQNGRIHSEEESCIIENKMKKLLDDMKIRYLEIKTDEDENKVINYLLGYPLDPGI